MKSDFIRRLFLINLGLAFAEGLVVLWLYLQTPSEPGAAAFLGFSALRLAILLGVFVVLGGAAYFFMRSSRRSQWEQRPGPLVLSLFEKAGTLWLLLLMFGSLYYLIFASDHYLGPLARFHDRLLPILAWLAALALQLLLSWLYARTFEFSFFENFRSLLIPVALALLSIFAIIGFVQLTKIGLTPDAVYWQEAGVPILFAQVLLVALVGVILHVLFTKFQIADNRKVDLSIFIALWVIAFLLWNGQSARPSFNSLAPVDPNFQSYPFGDAMRYDVTAQNFLIGKPIPADFWVKPFYSFFLALLHFVAGQDFGLVVTLQIFFLALVPAFAYLMTRLLGGRTAGIVVALLVTLREWNSLALSNILQVSHAKMLLSDIFSMGGMIVLTWLMLLWLENPSARRALPVAVGGVMGLLILTRGHPIVIIPFLFLLALFFLRNDRALLWQGLGRLTVGLLIVMVPWFLHTYEVTGRFAFQDNSSPFASRDAFVRATAEPSGAQPASYGQFEAQIIRQVLEEPGDVVRFVSAHYFHNSIFSYLYLPQSFQIESLKSYTSRLPFWGRWKGLMNGESWVLLLLNVAILALGFGAAWKRTKGLAFVPILIAVGYNLSVAISRRSGWRFMLPAEWVTLVFYGIGIVQLILLVHSLVARKMQEQTVQRPSPAADLPTKTRFPYGTGLAFLLIVSAVVWGHRLIPVAYPPMRASEILERYEAVPSASLGISLSELEKFSEQENAAVLYGKALYPVYYTPKDGTLSHSWLSYSRRPYNRIVFYLIGTDSTGVILPTNSWPTSFRDGTDVIVIGCRAENNVVQALSVAVTGDTPVIYQRDPLPALTCPLPEPQ